MKELTKGGKNMFSQELTKLYNTLALIETKGENTKIMAQCLVYIEQLIGAAVKNEQEKTESVPEKEE